MTREHQDAAARETIGGWFSGREDLLVAVATVIEGEGPGWWAHAIEPAPTPVGGPAPQQSTGLGCEDGVEIVEAALEVGYALLASWDGPAEERDEIASPARRLAVLRAMAVLAETELDAAPGGGA